MTLTGKNIYLPTFIMTSWPKPLNKFRAKTPTSFIKTELFLSRIKKPLNQGVFWWVLGEIKNFVLSNILIIYFPSLSNISLSKNAVSFFSLDLTQAFCFSSINSPIPDKIPRAGIFSTNSMHFLR